MSSFRFFKIFSELTKRQGSTCVHPRNHCNVQAKETRQPRGLSKIRCAENVPEQETNSRCLTPSVTEKPGWWSLWGGETNNLSLKPPKLSTRSQLVSSGGSSGHDTHEAAGSNTFGSYITSWVSYFGKKCGIYRMGKDGKDEIETLKKIYQRKRNKSRCRKRRVYSKRKTGLNIQKLNLTTKRFYSTAKPRPPVDKLTQKHVVARKSPRQTRTTEACCKRKPAMVTASFESKPPLNNVQISTAQAKNFPSTECAYMEKPSLSNTLQSDAKESSISDTTNYGTSFIIDSKEIPISNNLKAYIPKSEVQASTEQVTNTTKDCVTIKNSLLENKEKSANQSTTPNKEKSTNQSTTPMHFPPGSNTPPTPRESFSSANETTVSNSTSCKPVLLSNIRNTMHKISPSSTPECAPTVPKRRKKPPSIPRSNLEDKHVNKQVDLNSIESTFQKSAITESIAASNKSGFPTVDKNLSSTYKGQEVCDVNMKTTNKVQNTTNAHRKLVRCQITRKIVDTSQLVSFSDTAKDESNENFPKNNTHLASEVSTLSNECKNTKELCSHQSPTPGKMVTCDKNLSLKSEGKQIMHRRIAHQSETADHVSCIRKLPMLREQAQNYDAKIKTISTNEIQKYSDDSHAKGSSTTNNFNTPSTSAIPLSGEDIKSCSSHPAIKITKTSSVSKRRNVDFQRSHQVSNSLRENQTPVAPDKDKTHCIPIALTDRKIRPPTIIELQKIESKSSHKSPTSSATLMLTTNPSLSYVEERKESSNQVASQPIQLVSSKDNDLQVSKDRSQCYSSVTLKSDSTKSKTSVTLKNKSSSSKLKRVPKKSSSQTIKELQRNRGKMRRNPLLPFRSCSIQQLPQPKSENNTFLKTESKQTSKTGVATNKHMRSENYTQPFTPNPSALSIIQSIPMPRSLTAITNLNPTTPSLKSSALTTLATPLSRTSNITTVNKMIPSMRPSNFKSINEPNPSLRLPSTFSVNILPTSRPATSTSKSINEPNPLRLPTVFSVNSIIPTSRPTASTSINQSGGSSRPSIMNSVNNTTPSLRPLTTNTSVHHVTPPRPPTTTTASYTLSSSRPSPTPPPVHHVTTSSRASASVMPASRTNSSFRLSANNTPAIQKMPSTRPPKSLISISQTMASKNETRWTSPSQSETKVLSTKRNELQKTGDNPHFKTLFKSQNTFILTNNSSLPQTDKKILTKFVSLTNKSRFPTTKCLERNESKLKQKSSILSSASILTIQNSQLKAENKTPTTRKGSNVTANTLPYVPKANQLKSSPLPKTPTVNVVSFLKTAKTLPTSTTARQSEARLLPPQQQTSKTPKVLTTPTKHSSSKVEKKLSIRVQNITQVQSKEKIRNLSKKPIALKTVNERAQVKPIKVFTTPGKEFTGKGQPSVTQSKDKTSYQFSSAAKSFIVNNPLASKTFQPRLHKAKDVIQSAIDASPVLKTLASNDKLPKHQPKISTSHTAKNAPKSKIMPSLIAAIALRKTNRPRPPNVGKMAAAIGSGMTAICPKKPPSRAFSVNSSHHTARHEVRAVNSHSTTLLAPLPPSMLRMDKKPPLISDKEPSPSRASDMINHSQCYSTNKRPLPEINATAKRKSESAAAPSPKTKGNDQSRCRKNKGECSSPPRADCNRPPPPKVPKPIRFCPAKEIRREESCKAMKLPGCTVPTSITCLRPPLKREPCEKREAPQPSFSECIRTMPKPPFPTECRISEKLRYLQPSERIFVPRMTAISPPVIEPFIDPCKGECCELITIPNARDGDTRCSESKPTEADKESIKATVHLCLFQGKRLVLPGCAKPKSTACVAKVAVREPCVNRPRPPLPSFSECHKVPFRRRRYTECVVAAQRAKVMADVLARGLKLTVDTITEGRCKKPGVKRSCDEHPNDEDTCAPTKPPLDCVKEPQPSKRNRPCVASQEEKCNEETYVMPG